MSIHYKETVYGFEYGSATVSRCCSFDDGRVVMVVQTPKISIDIYVTRTGKIRVFRTNSTTEYLPVDTKQRVK